MHCGIDKIFTSKHNDKFGNSEILKVCTYCQSCGVCNSNYSVEFNSLWSTNEHAICEKLKNFILKSGNSFLLNHKHFVITKIFDCNLDTNEFGLAYVLKCSVCNKIYHYKLKRQFPCFSKPGCYQFADAPNRLRTVISAHFY